MVDHDIIRLDVSVDDFDDFMAVVQSSKNIDEIVPCNSRWDTDGLNLLNLAFSLAIKVMIIK
jgi:hypothetical protein